MTTSPEAVWRRLPNPGSAGDRLRNKSYRVGMVSPGDPYSTTAGAQAISIAVREIRQSNFSTTSSSVAAART